MQWNAGLVSELNTMFSLCGFMLGLIVQTPNFSLGGASGKSLANMQSVVRIGLRVSLVG